jgi:MFS family permease
VAITVWMTGGFYLSIVGELSKEVLGVEGTIEQGLLIAGLSLVGAAAVVTFGKLPPRTNARLGCAALGLGMAVGVTAIFAHSLVLFAVGTLSAGCGFGMAFGGAIGLVLPGARAHERGELFAAIYVVNYLAFGVPAIAAGALIGPLGLMTATVIYATAIIVCALMAVVAQSFRKTSGPLAAVSADRALEGDRKHRTERSSSLL